MIIFVYFVVMVSFLDMFSQLPILSPHAVKLGASSTMVGFIIGMYSLTNLVGNLLGGMWIDRAGSKKVLTYGLIMAALSLLIYLVVTSPIHLLLVRMIHGIGSGISVPAVYAYLGGMGSDRSKGRTMALSGAAIGLSAILGPFLGGFIQSTLGIHYVFIIVAVLMCITAIGVIFFLPESVVSNPKKVDSVTSEFITNVKTSSSWLRLLIHPRLITAYGASFSLMFALGIVTYFLPLKIQHAGLSSAYTGGLLSTYGLVAVLLFLLPTNRLSDRIGRNIPLYTGLFLINLSLCALGLFPSIHQLTGVMIVYGIGFALLFPAMSALIVDHTSDADRGKAFGFFYAFYSIGTLAGSSYVGLWNVSIDQGFFIGGITLFFIICSLLLRDVRRRFK